MGAGLVRQVNLPDVVEDDVARGVDLDQHRRLNPHHVPTDPVAVTAAAVGPQERPVAAARNV